MASRPDIRTQVDALLAAEKTLVGEAEFQALEGDSRKQRWRKPCAINGEVTPLELEIQAYPDCETLKFRAILVWGRAICRLDYASNEAHVNSPNRPRDLEIGPLNDPHFHSWSDNRRFSTRVSLPTNLPNARLIPANVRTYDAALRWFCGETRIILPSPDVPALPGRTTLL